MSDSQSSCSQSPQLLIFGDSIADDLRVIRTVIGSFAENTSTKIDDTVLEVIDLILASPALIDFIDGLVNAGTMAEVSQEMAAQSVLEPGLFAKIMKFAPLIVQLIQAFRSLKG